LTTCGACSYIRTCRNLAKTALCQKVKAIFGCQNPVLQMVCRHTCKSCGKKPVIPIDDGDPYFKPKPFVFPKPLPMPLGMASGVIRQEFITASSQMAGFETFFAGPLSGAAWCPLASDKNPWLQVNIGSRVKVHAFGVLGASYQKYWVTRYKVKVSVDGIKWKWLSDKNKQKIKIFRGNTENNKWSRFCIHRYYGQPELFQYVRFYPVSWNVRSCMRVELYGYRAPNDAQYTKNIALDAWTKKPTGCTCYWDKSRTDCACCQPGACQCSSTFKHQCVRCGDGGQCGNLNVKPALAQIDGWTKTSSGCSCPWNPKSKACACCQDNGCLCTARKYKNQCVQCGANWQCGLKPEVFGFKKLRLYSP